MKKRILAWLWIMLLLVSLSIPAFGVETVDTTRRGSLTIAYGEEGLDVSIYRVAEFTQANAYALTAPFDAYPVAITELTTQKQWLDAAQTLSAYAAADGVLPAAGTVTDESGYARFEGLPVGLYLVSGLQAQREDARVWFAPFMLFVPGAGADNSLIYDVQANPKSVTVQPQEAYTLLKLWKDGGKNRPEKIQVDILKDGSLWQTVELSSENNWSYTWQTTEPDSRWSVAEKNVPKGYTVEVAVQDNVFTVTNTAPDTPKDPPKTGDTTEIWPWLLAMCLSGCLLAVLGKRKAA